MSSKPTTAADPNRADEDPSRNHRQNVTMNAFLHYENTTVESLSNIEVEEHQEVNSSIIERRRESESMPQEITSQNGTIHLSQRSNVSNSTVLIQHEHELSLAATKVHECYSLNSEGWLQGPRLGNNGELMDDDYVRRMILEMPYVLKSYYDVTQPILSSTLCHTQSRFVNDTQYDAQDEKTIRLWAVRLVYLALHYHQHHWALPEAKFRLDSSNGSNSCTTPMESTNNHNSNNNTIGIFDYECPDAKFMIVPLKGHGLGANMRTTVVPALLVGLAANRVVVFVNNAETGNIDVRKPWPLASCNRRDHQCFFAPMTPCALTVEDIETAHVFENRGDFRRILKRNELPMEFDHAKVWLFRRATGHTVQLPSLAVERLQNYSNLLLESVSADDPRFGVLQKAVNAIGEMDPPRPNYNYAMASLKVHHALTFYAMRPNLKSADQLQAILQDILPTDFDPNHALGLPVRGSDKCLKESECLSFVEHMEAGSEVWTRHLNTTSISMPRMMDATVVFTTESKAIRQEQREFVSNASAAESFPFQFRFVANKHDVTPDTGYLPNRPNEDGMTADQAMLSSISSFQAQLMARATVGNCCSHYHHLLNDALSEGCGAARDNLYMCLQESDNPMLRVCCAWHPNCKRGE